MSFVDKVKDSERTKNISFSPVLQESGCLSRSFIVKMLFPHKKWQKIHCTKGLVFWLFCGPLMIKIIHFYVLEASPVASFITIRDNMTPMYCNGKHSFFNIYKPSKQNIFPEKQFVMIIKLTKDRKVSNVQHQLHVLIYIKPVTNEGLDVAI